MAQSGTIQSRTRGSHVALGYFVSCVASSVFFIGYFLATDAPRAEPIGELILGLIGAIGMNFVGTCLLALPGFLVLRLCLWRLQRSDWPSFALAGALNGAALSMLLWGPQTTSFELFQTYPPSPIFLALGALAGVVAWMAEKFVSSLNKSGKE